MAPLIPRGMRRVIRAKSGVRQQDTCKSKSLVKTETDVFLKSKKHSSANNFNHWRDLIDQDYFNTDKSSKKKRGEDVEDDW